MLKEINEDVAMCVVTMPDGSHKEMPQKFALKYLKHLRKQHLVYISSIDFTTEPTSVEFSGSFNIL